MKKWNILCRHKGLRVAYIDETEETTGEKSQTKKVYFSVLVKGGDKYDEVWTKNSSLMFSCEFCFTHIC